MRTLCLFLAAAGVAAVDEDAVQLPGNTFSCSFFFRGGWTIDWASVADSTSQEASIQIVASEKLITLEPPPGDEPSSFLVSESPNPNAEAYAGAWRMEDTEPAGTCAVNLGGLTFSPRFRREVDGWWAEGEDSWGSYHWKVSGKTDFSLVVLFNGGGQTSFVGRKAKKAKMGEGWMAPGWLDQSSDNMALMVMVFFLGFRLFLQWKERQGAQERLRREEEVGDKKND
eukprot:Hpha_TRINITY_DN8929_c0_g1::TRINITY_DN8929_c0_g1_i1::g.80931::m.80931